MTATTMAAAGEGSSTAAPLSVAQEALWYRAVLSPTALTYNEAISIRKDGPLDVAVLRRAFAAIVARHEAWRTTFDTVNGEPVQVVGRPPAFALPVLDLSELSEDEAEFRAAEVVSETARVPYDVRRGPLLRPRLIRFADDHHRLYLAMHHLIFDGVSLTRVVLPELTALYDAFRSGGADPLPDPPARYTDFARWEQAWIEEARHERRRAYWRRRLASAPSLSLALDHPRPAAPESRGGALGLTVPVETVGRLRSIGQVAGATLFQVLAATWGILLGTHAGQEEVVFAVAVDMRHRPEFQLLVGCAISPMALRLNLTGDPSFTDLVVRVRNELLDGLDNVMPFERLVRDLHPHVDGANPIYQTLLVLEPGGVTGDPDWSLHQMDARLANAVGASKVDLELQLDERPDGDLAGRLIYDRDLFERSTAARFVDHWLGLLHAAAAEPGAPIGRLAGLAPPEEKRQLVVWNATRTELRSDAVHELVSERARRQPEAIAVCDGSRRLSYAELDRGADETAAPRAADGAPSAQLVADALGALKAGTPLRLTATSGRTVEIGRPAAVNTATALAAELGISPGDAILVLPTTLARDPVSSLWSGLIAGARLVLAPADTAGDGARLRRLIRDEGVTLLQATPLEWEALIDSGLRSVRGLRALSGGGEGGGELSAGVAGRILDRCRVLWNGYAAPETTGYATLGRIELDGPVTIGRPIANTRTYVVDGHGRPAAIGVPGELIIAGAGVTGGYVDGEDGGRFFDDPFARGRAFHTGQRVRRRADGQLEVVADC